MAVPNIFATKTGTIPLSELDANFATPVTIGTTPVALGNIITSITSVSLVTPALGTPTSGNLINCTNVSLTSAVSGVLPVLNGGTGVATSTGTGSVVLNTSPTLVTPALGTPTSGNLINCTLPQLSASTGSILVGTIQSGTGPVTRTVASKLNDAVSVKDFGAVGDGVTNDNIPVLAAEASGFEYINLVGLNVLTTLTEAQISKKYFNGTMTYTNSNGSQAFVKPTSPLPDLQIQRPRTKSLRLDWDSKRVLWLGTSIPQEGGSVDSYPTLFGRDLNCTVDNMAWAGSAAEYDVTANAFDITTIKRLSMTEDDRLAGLALYGPTSAYDDSFDVITKASTMTCDYRIKQQFSSNPYDAVMLDHNHNDRLGAFGILNPATTNVTAVTIGATTTFTASGHGLAVGDAVIFCITGIPFLDYAAGRVQSVAGTSFVLNINSSAYTGTFASGTVAKVDRNTICGAWNFLISYIKNTAIIYGNSDCNITLSGAPNEYTAGRTKPYEVYSNAEQIRQVAEKWGLSFFDIGFYYDIKPQDEPIYFPDGYHPTTLAARQALANQWVTWAQGGASLKVNGLDFLPAGVNKTYTNQREALYSKYVNGFGTPPFIVGASTNLITDTFTSLTGWTTAGTTPTVGAAPWGVGNAVNFNVATADSTIAKNVAFTNGTSFEFDIYLPTTVGLTTGATKTVGILSQQLLGVGIPSGIVAGAQLLITSTGVSLRGYMFNAAAAINYTAAINLNAATKYTVKIEAIQGTSVYTGTYLLYVNSVLVGGIYNLDFSTFLVLPQSILLGIGFNNLGALNMSVGNLVVDSLTVNNYTQRYTGTFTTADSPAKTVTVVNGIIVSAV